jgi:hypothetical protein
MQIAAALYAVLFLGAAGIGLAWVVRRLPAGWKGVRLGLAALAGSALLAFGGWFAAVQTTDSARFLCTGCGRMEQRTRILGIPVWRRPLQHDEYARRFAGLFAHGHAHEWRVQGCIQSFGKVTCTMEYQDGWFRLLPRLSDRAAAEALAREACALSEERRVELLTSFQDGVVTRVEFRDEDLDAAFATWRSQRGR